MKTLIISAIFCLSVTILSAQEILELDETQLTYAPYSASISQNEDSFTYKVSERFNGQFAEDPIAFMNTHFDIQKVIEASEDKNYDSYLVTFKSDNGYLKADFDGEGELLETRQNFKNVILPLDLRIDIHSTYKGWTLVKTKYNAKTKGDLLVKAFYRVKLENGKQRQNLKIDARNQGIGVAVN
jgi:hypothetical protein|tara:strand:- start:3504 stop:4055 length:552 start_codon:yes stop_codon:yes gene_type:complete